MASYLAGVRYKGVLRCHASIFISCKAPTISRTWPYCSVVTCLCVWKVCMFSSTFNRLEVLSHYLGHTFVSALWSTQSLLYVDLELNPRMGASRVYLHWCHYSDHVQKWFTRWLTSLLRGEVSSVWGVWWLKYNNNTSVLMTSVLAINDGTGIWMIVVFTNGPVVGTESFAQQFGNQFCGVIQLNISVYKL